MCDFRNFHDSAVMWVLKHYLSGPFEAVIKARVLLLTETAKSHEGA